MKVAIVNKFFFLRGGQETLMYEEAKMLEEAGNEVAFFSMKHPQNPTNYKYDKYFVEYVEFSNTGKEYSLLEKLKLAKNFIYNNEAAQKFECFIKEFNPDIIHCHGIAHQITFSILPVAKKYNIPVVQTLHDYQPACPCYTLLKAGKTVCYEENCASSFYINCILNKCVKSSLSASVLSAVEMLFNYKINNFSRYVDKYICPSNFLKEIVSSKGFDAEKFVHIPNFVNVIENYQPEFSNNGYFLYFGRLSYEKGLFTLLKAFMEIPEAKLKILGSGPLEADLLKFKEDNNINNVEFLGFQYGEALSNWVKNSIAVILPAEWHENAPMSIIEAFAWGKPVIASKLGGSPEMITDNETGYLFNHGNTEELKAQIFKLINNENLAADLGKNAREFALKNYNSQKHFDMLIKLYNSL